MQKLIDTIKRFSHSDNIDFEALKKLLEPVNDQSILNELVVLFQSELDRSYFEPNHYTETLQNRSRYNYETSVLASKLLGVVFPTYDFGALEEKWCEYEPSTVETAINQLDKDGYWMSDTLLKEAQVDAIVSSLSSKTFVQKRSRKKINGYKESNIYNITDNTAWIRDQDDILAIPEVQSLIVDKTILSIIQGYLGCIPIHCQANTWWTIRKKESKDSLSKNAQLFHQDKEFIRFVKVFIYLNDVTKDNGPHEYVLGSPKNYEEHVPENYKFSDRLSDEFIKKEYGEDKVISVTGKAGTIIFEDTSGFHKGTPVVEGHRLLLQLEYCCSLYLNPTKAFSPNVLSEKLDLLAEKYPRVFLNYNQEKSERDKDEMIRNEKNFYTKMLNKKFGYLINKYLPKA